MAKNTDLVLKQSVIYQVYNRNHNESGTFRELIKKVSWVARILFLIID